MNPETASLLELIGALHDPRPCRYDTNRQFCETHRRSVELPNTRCPHHRAQEILSKKGIT